MNTYFRLEIYESNHKKTQCIVLLWNQYTALLSSYNKSSNAHTTNYISIK